jgi:hypothetical protein
MGAFMVIIIIMLAYLVYKNQTTEESMISGGLYNVNTSKPTCGNGVNTGCKPNYYIDSDRLAPNMDYTYGYWNGVKRLSCDECPNGAVCPHCPQYRGYFRPGYFADTKSLPSVNEVIIDDKINKGIVDPHSDKLRSDIYLQTHAVNPYKNYDSHLNGLDSTYKGEYFIGSGPNEEYTAKDIPSSTMQHDLDTEFTSTREKMGASTSKSGHVAMPLSINGIDESLSAATNDARFDNTASLAISNYGKTSRIDRLSSNAQKLMYADVMGLTNPPPDQSQCEYLRYNGYLYKEDCTIGDQHM